LNPQPKPLRRPPKAPKPLRRSRMKRKPTRPRRGADPAYVAWLHEQSCVGEEFKSYPVHHCGGRIEQSHDRNMTGLGRKEPDRRSIPMCSDLHAQWEARSGWFAGWDKEKRVEYMGERIARYNTQYDAEHPGAVAEDAPGAP